MYAFNNPGWNKWLIKWFPWLLLFGIVANATGLFVTILEPDGALYATIARTMAQSGDFINLKVEGKDWLDKPHFPFWVTAISFRIFGVGTISYKLPAFLFWAGGGIYLYLFAKEVYNQTLARLSVLIYLTAAHLVISNNDVRAEPYLTGLIIGSVFHFYRASGKGISVHLVLGSLLAAFAMMTKGPFVLIIIVSGFIADWIVRKDWKQFYHYRWWLAMVMVLIFILPELYCLYEQFDRHPTKIVFGNTGVSGIRFFFWDSQFGRFLNTGPIQGKGDLFFYVHTLLWAFLPWSILFFAAAGSAIRTIKTRRLETEAITMGCSLVTFILFSLSRFQLPHYMNIVFPFFSIITARYLYMMSGDRLIRIWSWIQHILCFLLMLLLVIITLYFKPGSAWLIVAFLVSLFGVVLYVFRDRKLTGILGRSFLTSVLLYAFLNVFFYPALLHYQSGSNAADFINKEKLTGKVGTYRENSYSFAFYLNQPFAYYTSLDSIMAHATQQDMIIFTKEEDLRDLSQPGLTITILKVFPHFHISQLTGKFLNSATRDSVTGKMVVARISRHG